MKLGGIPIYGLDGEYLGEADSVAVADANNIIGSTESIDPVYAAALNAAYAEAKASMGASTGIASVDWQKLITDNLPKIPAALSAFQLSQVNLARAEKGLPALNAASYGPQVGVGLTPQTQQLLTYGLLGLAGVMLLKKFAK